MTTQTKSRILFTTFILAGMSTGFILLSQGANSLYSILLVFAGLGLLAWVWKPWQWFNKE